MSTETTEETKKTELELLSTLCDNWRQTRISKFSPMPPHLEKYISNTIASKRYEDLEIISVAKISHKRFAKIAGRELKNSEDNNYPDLIPFTLIPKITEIKNQNNFNKSTFKTAEANNIIINISNGNSISIPLTLNEVTMQNIIKTILCCK